MIMSKKKRKQTNTFLQSKNKKNMMSVKQKSKKGKVLYKVEYHWDVRKRKVYSPSYERLESFLKEVGNKSPFEYSQKMKPEDDINKKSTGYLVTIWREVLGETIKKDKFGKNKKYYTEKVFDWFIQLEHLITNNEMFWTLLPEIWLNRSHIITNGNEDIFNRYGRMDVPFETRMECVEHLNIIGGESTLREGIMNGKMLMDIYENMDDKITIYRSFKCEKGKSIRKGHYKKNNPQSHIQEEGRGWSYSLNKSNSVFVNGLYNSYYYKKYLGWDDEKTKQFWIKKRGKTNEDLKKDPTIYEGFFDCLGIYKVKKKDVLFMTDSWGENEVVVDPINVDLIDYNFLNIFDFITLDFLLSLFNGIGVERSSIHNIDGVYSVFHKIIKKNIKYFPKLIGDYLSFKNERFEIIEEWFRNIFPFKGFVFDRFSHKGGSSGFGILGIENKEDQSMRMFPNSVNSHIQLPSNIPVIKI